MTTFRVLPVLRTRNLKSKTRRRFVSTFLLIISLGSVIYALRDDRRYPGKGLTSSTFFFLFLPCPSWQCWELDSICTSPCVPPLHGRPITMAYHLGRNTHKKKVPCRFTGICVCVCVCVFMSEIRLMMCDIDTTSNNQPPLPLQPFFIYRFAYVSDHSIRLYATTGYQ